MSRRSRSEIVVFRAFAEDFPDSAVVLVDTYDAAQGIANAITVTGELALDPTRLASASTLETWPGRRC